MEWVAGVCFSSLCAALCDSIKSSARPLGAPVSLVPGASGSGSRRFGGSAYGQGSVEPASGAGMTSGSVRASSSYLVTIQQFISSSVSPGVWLNSRLWLGGLLVRDINLVGI